MRIKGKTMCFVTSDPMRKKIEEIAAQTGGTMSTVINQLMAEGLAAPSDRNNLKAYVDQVVGGLSARLTVLESAKAKQESKWIEKYERAANRVWALEQELAGKLDRPI
mgnify:CR=1 FL=1